MEMDGCHALQSPSALISVNPVDQTKQALRMKVADNRSLPPKLTAPPTKLPQKSPPPPSSAPLTHVFLLALSSTTNGRARQEVPCHRRLDRRCRRVVAGACRRGAPAAVLAAEGPASGEPVGGAPVRGGRLVERPCDDIYVEGEGETLHTISVKCGDPFIEGRYPHILGPHADFPGLVI
ncbi:Peptidoglycan-binding LysM domain-containing protein [Musa troglodytarum]|uniref:Peptidoglycan-binding LysM domain-containing protein n=1 Tax=Musa troglodytarum TaxID=320322 RepID=A0A9E7EVU3_9LILI|nr:Peptidoglycan-binding LysM domain-containing protein [Musa troglodytarum]